MLEELLSAVKTLEAHIVLNIPAKTISEVVDRIEITEKLGIKVDSIDRILGKIDKKIRPHELMQQAQVWETQLPKLKKQMHNLEHKLAEPQTNMLTEGLSIYAVKDYNIKVLNQ